jgi:hypothetical protein
MNPEIKAQWLADLRSDEFAQATGYLRDQDAYCCLGVLCKQAAAAGVVTETRDEEDTFRYGGAIGALPDEVVDWAGLDDTDPYVDFAPAEGDETFRESLSSINDDYKKNFREIADLIEAQL